MTKTEIITLQTKLSEMGYDVEIDGWYGKQTKEAYSQYLKDSQLETSHSLTPMEQKPWYLSKALIGTLVTIIAAIAGLFGWDFDSPQLTEVLLSLITLISGIVSLVATIRRTTTIKPIGNYGFNDR